MRSAMQRGILIVATICLACTLLFNLTTVAQAECKWFGTAPMCSGSCPGGWYTMKKQSTNYVQQGEPGFGSYCYSGKKALCCRACASGLVWREATYLDVVCVTPAERARAQHK